MTPAGRACLGALLGAILTLVAHPISRPFMLSAISGTPQRKLVQCVDHNLGQPPAPHNLDGASLWLQFAAERIVARRFLRPKEMSTTLEITDRAAQLEPENAYWPQMKAVLLASAGQSAPAYAAWKRASRCSVWIDYQTKRLTDARERLAQLTGAHQAWQYAYVLHERSEVPALLVERYSRSLLAQSGFDKREDIETRYVTLINNDLLRTGSRSTAVGDHGAKVVELVAYPKDLIGTISPKRLWVGQNNLLKQMSNVGMVEEMSNARQAFANNEAWRAFTPDDPNEMPNELSLASVLSATVIGACAVAAFAGAVIWGAGWLISARLGNRLRYSIPIVAGFATVLGTLCAILTHDLWAVMVGVLASAFLLVGPSQPRTAQPEDLGPLFSFLLIVIATMSGLAIGAYGIFQTPPAGALLPQLGIPSDYYSTPLSLGLACIFITLALIAVPIWSLVQKLATPHVLGLAIRKVGIYLAYGSLATGILLGPVAVYADREMDQTLGELVGNEPLYYIIHQ